MDDTEHDRQTSTERGYNARWRRSRKRYLQDNPLCVLHLSKGRTVPATVVDHIEPHKGNDELFWDKSNWQSVCDLCHNNHKQRLEKFGDVMGCDVNGVPDDKNHSWNR